MTWRNLGPLLLSLFFLFYFLITIVGVAIPELVMGILALLLFVAYGVVAVSGRS